MSSITLETLSTRIINLEKILCKILKTQKQEVKYSLRQSMWKKTKNVLDVVKKTEVITLPGLHTDSYEELNNLYQNNITILNKEQQMINEIKKNDLIVIFENRNRERALLIRMKGDVEIKEISNVLIYRKKGFNNGYEQNKDVIQVSLENVLPPDKFTSRKKMWACIRQVEIVREINKDEILFQKYWKFQGHIIRNRQDERFTKI